MTIETRVYSFAAKHPTDGVEIVAEQISSAHRYYNQLIELRREQYVKTEAAKISYSVELAKAEGALAKAEEDVESLFAAIRARNALAKRKVATQQDRDALAAAKEYRRDCYAARKAIRQALATDTVLQVQLAKIYADTKANHKAARAVCGVYWGSYLKIEEGVEAAVKKSIGPPSFRRWTGDGLVAVQIQHGLTIEELFIGQDNRVRIVKGPPRGKHKSPLNEVWLRIGSNGEGGKGGAPIWAKVPVYMHRPFPSDAIVMGISLVRRQIAMRRSKTGWHPYYEWTCDFTIRSNQFAKRMATDGACGVDLGWRIMEDNSLRVAYIVGDDGRNEQIMLPASFLARWTKCDDLLSIRDKLFVAIRAKLADWLVTITPPQWLTDATKFMAVWCGKGKLANVVKLWTDQRFPGDEEMFSVLEAWHTNDVHLWQWQRHNERKAQRQRQALYRQLAAELRQRYAKIAVEDCDWRTLAVKASVMRNESDNVVVRRHQRIASVGMLRACLKDAGAEMVDSAETTSACHECGKVNEWDHAQGIMHTCDDCEAVWDQDENAARNLLARVKVVSQTPGTARVPQNGTDEFSVNGSIGGGRWARRKAERSRGGVKTNENIGSASMAVAMPVHGA